MLTMKNSRRIFLALAIVCIMIMAGCLFLSNLKLINRDTCGIFFGLSFIFNGLWQNGRKLNQKAANKNADADSDEEDIWVSSRFTWICLIVAGAAISLFSIICLILDLHMI